MPNVEPWSMTDTFKPARMQNLVDGVNGQMADVAHAGGDGNELHNLGKGRTLFDPREEFFQNSPVSMLVGNVSGAIVEPYRAVVLLDAVQAVQEDDAKDTPILEAGPLLKADKPSSATAGVSQWGVTQGKVDNDQFGPCVIMGLTWCRINLIAKTDRLVDIVSGSHIPASGSSGPAKIVYIKGGAGNATSTGEQWAVILLGGGGSGVQPTGNSQFQVLSMSSDHQTAWLRILTGPMS